MDQSKMSDISLVDAEDMAKHGEHAAQILSKAFPGMTLMLMYSEVPPKIAAR